MTCYELMLDTNRRLIMGELLTDEEKAYIAAQFLNGAHVPAQAVSYDQNPSTKARKPLFFLPPENEGKKLKTILGQTPKTHILSGNMYELEILRLLCMFAPNNPVVIEMTTQTLNRLKSTCFGYHGCFLGECFDAALVVLRFLAVAAPKETQWMKKIIRVYTEHSAEKKRVKAVENYYRLCLSEMPHGIAEAYAAV